MTPFEGSTALNCLTGCSKFCLGDKVKYDHVSGACSTHGISGKFIVRSRGQILIGRHLECRELRETTVRMGRPEM